jgi:WD40 repeat protein
MCAAIWRIPSSVSIGQGDDNVTIAPPLELQTSIDSSSYGSVKSVLWHPTGESSSFVILADSDMVVCDLEPSTTSAKVVAKTTLDGKTQPKFTCGKWNPHHNCIHLATANDTFIRGWDLRTLQQVYCIENAHGQFVRDLDFNPNKQYYLGSCGDDCKTKFWDIRNTAEPVKVLSDHSHWVWNVRYNHFHDQLVLTSSSDSRVILTNLTSISSEPYGHLMDDDLSDEDDSDTSKTRTQVEPMKDGVVSVYEEHEDSVYAVEWSSSDPWIFASLSYDGRLVINRVPRATKYSIIL